MPAEKFNRGSRVRPAPPRRPLHVASPASLRAPLELKLSLDLSERSGDASVQQYCKGLTPQQRRAVFANSRELMIIACAGSGKTRTLTARIGHFLQRGAPSHNVLAITFTRKAAGELKTRIEELVGWKRAAGVLVANFHQFALRVLRQHYSEIGFTQQFLVLGARDQKDIVKECVRRCEGRMGGADNVRCSMERGQARDTTEDDDQVIDMMIGGGDRGSDGSGGGIDRGAAFRGGGKGGGKDSASESRIVNYFTSFIRKAKRERKGPQAFEDPAHREIYAAYVSELRRRQAIDFSDMVPLTLHLFKKREDILRQAQASFKFVFVDEFQDVTNNQFELLRALAKGGGHITVCGDDDQSIYGWRGATVQGFEHFASAFPAHQTVILDQTFRNTGCIVSAIKSLIAQNRARREKVLWTENKMGEHIDFANVADKHKEAQRVVAEIKARMETYGLQFRDFAVLSRTRRGLRAMGECFKRNRIPYTSSTAGAKPLLQAKHVADLLSFLELAATDSDRAFERVLNVPRRGLGTRILNVIRDLARSEGRSFTHATRTILRSQMRGVSSKHKAALDGFLRLVGWLRSSLAEGGLKATLEGLLTRTSYTEHVKKRCARVEDLEQKTEAISALLRRATGFDHAARNTKNGESAAQRTKAFLAYLRSQEKVGERNPDHVTLSTIHQAKGLEWPVVFVVHFNDGVLPLTPRERDGTRDMQMLEEERRLAYVAMSRAKVKLFISSVQRDDLGAPLLPSRFLDDVPTKLLQKGASLLEPPPRPNSEQGEPSRVLQPRPSENDAGPAQDTGTRVESDLAVKPPSHAPENRAFAGLSRMLKRPAIKLADERKESDQKSSTAGPTIAKKKRKKRKSRRRENGNSLFQFRI